MISPIFRRELEETDVTTLVERKSRYTVMIKNRSRNSRPLMDKMVHLNYPLQGDRIMRMTEHRHDTHPEIIKRLRRAEGHLKSVIAMIEGGRPCLDIAQQLQAVEKAITNAKRTLIQDHLDHCLDDAVGPLGGDQRRTIDEFKTITKYL